jgi:serine phosphatase RsbU (regulator of sigma subunit)
VIANAGHPAPFLNRQEVAAPGALPLGLIPVASYEESTVHLETGDHFVLYTDGLLEARTTAGELFGFERLRALFSGSPNAEQATEAAMNFGQQDDITVLTLTRLAVGEQASTQLTAPEPAPA